MVLGLWGAAAMMTIIGRGEAFTDTELWMGAEYTPAAAPANGYWWQWYEVRQLSSVGVGVRGKVRGVVLLRAPG